ncbi:MAG: DUF3151 domain-containing protein [Candidatus Dormibacteraeota bacterium]|nr:DUF3151 domain-containing protein [Candidatus Dormibacteraeota bacterium]
MRSDPSHPFRNVPVAGDASGATPPRHETVLSPEPAAQLEALCSALAGTDDSARRMALSGVAGAHPSLLEAWARLSEVTLAGGDAVSAYAFARVAYHRGLDRLRREGWGGTGMVRWSQPSNRGFLRGLHALLAASAALDERDESSRCRAFLLELDPGDTLGVAAYPETPGPRWTAPPLPE